MGNEEFIDKFPHAHVVFLPNLIFDHSPNVMIFPNSLHTKKRAFKFSNFVADKKEFNPTVMNIWNGVYEGCHMFRLINIDKRPDSKQIREKESRILSEYVEAMKVEEKLLFQKAKIKWLCLGDRNNSYFHKVLKSRNTKSRMNQIIDDQGNIFVGEDVANQFVKHFQVFLGKAVQVQNLDNIESLISKKLAPNVAADMIRAVSDEEIK
ncbi:hypothetical protein Tco_0136178, partial [Tanacetum coccineum]